MSWAVLVSAAIGYLLGSIPFGLVLTRLAGLGDIRQIGSGNIGATNVLRHRPGQHEQHAERRRHRLAAVIIGHIFPVWLGFRGGKAVATALGVLLVLAWPVALFTGLLWLATAA